MAQLDLLSAADPIEIAPPAEKSPEALRTITEIAAELDVPQHVLRFWETRFSKLQPVKINGRRYYRPEDVLLLRGIQHLLYHQGYTIRGAQAALESGEAVSIAPAAGLAGDLDEKTRTTLHSALAELKQMRSILQTLCREPA